MKVDNHFRTALAVLLKHEGGYVDDPLDSGGETNYGITVKTARRYGYSESMRDIPMHVVEHIYFRDYWLASLCDRISEMDYPLAYQVFDFGVNAGIRNAGRTLQAAINACKAYRSPLVVDGYVGGKTIHELGALHEKRETLLACTATYKALRITYYMQLAQRRPKDTRFLFGWLKRVAEGEHA